MPFFNFVENRGRKILIKPRAVCVRHEERWHSIIPVSYTHLTCSVTNNADHKSLKMVRHFKRQYPLSTIVVCGCSSQNNREAYEKEGIDILLGNREKSKIVSLLKAFFQTHEKYTYITKERKVSFEDMAISKFTTHTRAFVKI